MPETHVPLPPHPMPPHWDHLANVPPGGAEVVDDTNAVLPVVLVLIVDVVLPAAVLVPTVVVALPDAELTAPPPGPATDVVNDPLSM